MRILVILTCLLVGCSAPVEKPTKNLPYNAASNLLLQQDTTEYPEIVRAEESNIDFINGFRSLKLGMHFDSIYLNDWNLRQDSFLLENSVKKYQNEIDLDFVDGDSVYLVTLTFFRDTLREISITDYNSPYSVNESMFYNSYSPKVRDKIVKVYGYGQREFNEYDQYQTIGDLVTTVDPIGVKSSIRYYKEYYTYEGELNRFYTTYEWEFESNKAPGINQPLYVFYNMKIYLSLYSKKTTEELSRISSESFKIEYEKRQRQKEEFEAEGRKGSVREQIENF